MEYLNYLDVVVGEGEVAMSPLGRRPHRLPEVVLDVQRQLLHHHARLEPRVHSRHGKGPADTFTVINNVQ